MMKARQYAAAALFVLAIVSMIACVIAGLTGCTTLDWVKDHGGSVPSIPAITNIVPPVVNPPATNAHTIGKWHGPNGANARETFAMRSASIAGGKVRVAYDKPSWDADVNNTLICFAVKRDGVWEGGKFDWVRKGQTVKLTENIVDGYIKAVLPMVSGEDVLIWIMHVKGTERSTFALTKWP
jgi:hypothetical protein